MRPVGGVIRVEQRADAVAKLRQGPNAALKLLSVAPVDSNVLHLGGMRVNPDRLRLAVCGHLMGLGIIRTVTASEKKVPLGTARMQP